MRTPLLPYAGQSLSIMQPTVKSCRLAGWISYLAILPFRVVHAWSLKPLTGPEVPNPCVAPGNLQRGARLKVLTGRGSELIITKSSFWTKALSRSMNGVKRANRMRA